MLERDSFLSPCEKAIEEKQVIIPSTLMIVPFLSFVRDAHKILSFFCLSRSSTSSY